METNQVSLNGSRVFYLRKLLVNPDNFSSAARVTLALRLPYLLVNRP